ncbi:MAG TPA: sialate O-acetylesterase [Armatimonadota bacterium]|jgi:sialate O-acetylesterase
MKIQKLLLPLLALLCAATIHAQPMAKRQPLLLASLFTDHMVLQRELPVPVWGTATPGATVTVTFDKLSDSTIADRDGNWLLRLPPLKAGGPFELVVVAGGETRLLLHDVLVGDVWICSGQSNMEFPVSAARNAKKEIANANYPTIRLFTVRHAVSLIPERAVNGQWVACTPETVAGFSAMSYFFARDLQPKIRVPIGLIQTCWPGTVIEAWTEEAALHAESEFAPILARIPPELGHTLFTPLHENTPSVLYNAMIHPLIPFAMRGVLWSQGSANADRAYQYRLLFPNLIRSWRQAWGEGDFSFLFVQLPNYMARRATPTDSAWAELREAQAMAMALPNTGMAVTIDIGEAFNLHPKNKQDIGLRLARAAEAVAYHLPTVASGPRYRAMKVEGQTIRLAFESVGAGLVAKDNAKLKGFAIAGSDRQFLWAQAKIDGESVVVWNDALQRPVAVRYAWADNPECNFFNANGLPASPFRTDDWPGLTINAR